MHSAQQSGSSYPLAQGLHRDLVASTLFWSNPLGVGRFFCDVAAMRLRFGCDAKRESLCEIIDVMKTWCPLFVASCRARRRSTSLRGPYRFGAGRTVLRQAATLRGTEARLGADTFVCCVLGRSWLPNVFKGVHEKVDATDHLIFTRF